MFLRLAAAPLLFLLHELRIVADIFFRQKEILRHRKKSYLFTGADDLLHTGASSSMYFGLRRSSMPTGINAAPVVVGMVRSDDQRLWSAE